MGNLIGSVLGGLSGAGRLLGVIVLLTALLGLPLSASAQGSAERYVFYLVASPHKKLTDLCVGDVVKIDVKAERFLANKRWTDTATNTSPPVQMYGVTVTGTVGIPEVGRLFFPSRITSPRGTPPGTAQFRFTATKAGTTGIVFTGVLHERNSFLRFFRGDQTFLSTELEVAVKDCAYKVGTATSWTEQDRDIWGARDYFAYAPLVRIASKGAGSLQYIGSSTYSFVTEENPYPCKTHPQFFEAAISIEGTRVDDELVLNITYERPMGTEFGWGTDSGTCHLKFTEQNLTFFPDLMTVSVPASGGSVTLEHTLVHVSGQEMGGGRMVVTVVPVGSE